jgi:hypothetical protein
LFLYTNEWVKMLGKYIDYIKLLFSTIKLRIDESILNLCNKNILIVSLCLWQTTHQTITLRDFKHDSTMRILGGNAAINIIQI